MFRSCCANFRQNAKCHSRWVEAHILELGEIFACGIYSYSVMSNHLRLVVHMSPTTARDWSAVEVAVRWVKLYPAQTAELFEQKIAESSCGLWASFRRLCSPAG